MIPPTLKILHSGLYSALEGDNNPDHTLNLTLTTGELGAVSLGMFLTYRVFPELGPVILGLATKIEEVSKAQGFLDWTPPPPIKW